MTKLKKRGFVMTGGGAKGLYEAGVINAFHICGMEFDIITGSSIGAMNSAFFSEYLFFKKQLPAAVQADPPQAVEAMDERVRAYHHAWLQMPDKKLVDDSEAGPIGQMKNDLLHFDLNLPFLASLAWWWTDPKRSLLPAASLPDAAKMGIEFIEHIGGLGKFLDLVRHDQKTFLSSSIRAYLAKFKIEHALVPPDQDHKLRDIFTQDISPLTLEHLIGDISAPDEPGTPQYKLVDPARKMSEYASAGITMRVTRTNYRTGRLEISAYMQPEDFVRFLEKHAWRVETSDMEKVPLGSLRMLLPGDPNAVEAALCSGRFPGVFAPFPLERIYPTANPANDLLYQLSASWLDQSATQEALKQAYLAVHPDGRQFDAQAAKWRSPVLREFFPKTGDVYVDGGTIDNTPSNGAVDFVREWVDQDPARSRRDWQLELFVIFLDPEPKLDPEKINDPSAYDVVQRTLAIQAAAKSSSDANNVSVINTFGQRGEALGYALSALIGQLQKDSDSLPAVERQNLEQALFAQVKQWDPGYDFGDKPEGLLGRLGAWADLMMARKLPLEVNAIKIYPEEMPMDTLQFTERLGYRKENAIRMITMGCANTLWALRAHLEGLSSRDEQDERSLKLARAWLRSGSADNAWSSDAAEQSKARRKWTCQRSGCVYFAQHCERGERAALAQEQDL